MLVPEKFIEKYRNLLGQEADDFLATFDQEAISGFRVNPLKNTQHVFENPIPNTPWGHYGKVSGKSAELVWSIHKNLLLKWLLKLQHRVSTCACLI